MSRFERWSRRKLGSESSDENDEVVVDEVGEAPSLDGHDEPPGGISPSENSEHDASQEALSSGDPAPGSLDDTLPDPDTLPPGSDIKAFLVPGVSPGLRRRALRRLFAGDNYGIRDGLDDYDLDYREKLKPLASELAQRMRQWTRPVDPPEEEDDGDEVLTETSHTAPASPEYAAASETVDQERDERHQSANEPPEVGPEDLNDASSSIALDEGRIGARHQSDQD